MQPGSRWFTATVLSLAVTAGLSAQSTSSSSGAKAKNTSTATTALSQQIQQLTALVQTQQQQIAQQSQQVNQLRSQVQQLLQSTQDATAAAQKAEQAQSAATEAKESADNAQKVAEQASSNAAAVQNSLSAVSTRSDDQARQLTALAALAGRFRISADLRIRGESYNQDGVPDRNRARIRMRWGLDGQLNQDFVGGFAIATGSMGDPTSTNETLTNVFDRKTIALDRAFVTYNPVAHPWLSLTGGKFAYTWLRTSQTFDPDLNPEGFDEKFSFDFAGPVQNFTVQGIELLYNEANGKPGVPSQDSYALGVQASARLQYGPWTGTPSFLSLKWNRPDAILQQSAFATAATTTGFLPSGSTTPVTGIPIPGEGQGCAKGFQFPSFPPCVFAPNGMTNATYVDSKGVPHFYSGYNYADFIINNQFQDGLPRLPINLLAEFLDNLDAENHPLDTKENVLYNLGSQNKEYGFDFSLGQVRNRNDVQFGYSWWREEQDAAIASFVESDQRAPTNILQNRFYGLWKVRANTTAGFTWWRGRTLNTYLENNAALFNNYSSIATIKKAGQQEPYLNRLQFDLIYTY
jgi:Putative porin